MDITYEKGKINMSISIDNFLEYEKSNNLLNANIEGFYFWGYIRFKLYSEIINEKEKLQSQSTGTNKRIVKYLFKSLIQNNPFFSKKKPDLLVFQHPRKVREGDYYECIYTDPFLKDLNLDYLVFERNFNGKHYSPVKHSNIKYTDALDILSVGLSKIIFRKKSFNQLADIISKIVIDLNSLYDTNIDSGTIIDFAIKLYKRWIIQKKIIRLLLNRYKPKCILEVVYYSFSNLIINEVAKELKIPTIELQHGTMGRHHIAYNFSNKGSLPYFPDKIFLFSNYWKENSRLPLGDKDLIVTGFPYLEKNMYKHYFDNIEAKTDYKKTTILFVSQLTIGEVSSKFAYDYIKLLGKDAVKYRIIYKLHASEFSDWKSRYPWLLEICDDIEIIEDNNTSIYDFFAISDIQIGFIQLHYSRD